jgi:hypothetical protein
MMSRVFLPQIVQRFDAAEGKMRPAFDFSAAAQFGQLIPILDAHDDPVFLARITSKIKKALEDFSEKDYLLAVGDPAVIAVCAGLILRRNGTRLNMLKWDRRLAIYIHQEINL